MIHITDIMPGQRTADWVLARARRQFLAGERLEMGELARDAGVNRATLFRWFGGRERFLGEVVWSITLPTLDALAARPVGTGGRRIANLLADFAAVANGADHFGAFLRREPQRAMRVMTTPDGGVQQRIVDRVAVELAAEVDAGRLEPVLPVPDLAFLLVRLCETFVYANVITGGEPDAEKVRVAAGALLGVGPEVFAAPGEERDA